MAAKIFGTAMDNDISAKVQRSLKIWCQEGIVDDNQKIIFMGYFADSTQITDLHGGVGRCFQKDGFSVGLNGSLNFFQFRSMHRVELYAVFGVEVAEQTEGATVEIVASDDVVTRCEQIHNRINCSHTGGKSQGIDTVLQCCQKLLQACTRRVGFTCIIKACGVPQLGVCEG